MDGVARFVVKAAHSVRALLNEGLVGFLREVNRDSRREITQKQERLKLLLNGNHALQQAVKRAQKMLDGEKEGIETRIREADDEIKRIEEDTKLGVMQHRYKQLKEDFEAVQKQVETIRGGLKLMHKGLEQLKDTFDAIKNSLFRIKSIGVKVSSKALTSDQPMEFSITVARFENEFTVVVRWAPMHDLGELYKLIAHEILGFKAG
jgi:DNA repair exonuclease SbcCD ATPase subunit